MDVNRIIQGDALSVLKTLPSDSVDLICTDPPYNIKIAKWDSIKNYTAWMGSWILECQRILKDNGSFYWFHSDMNQASQVMEWIRLNTEFVFNSFLIWDKGDFRALSWKNPGPDNNLRSWFNTCEFIFFYTFQDDTGLTNVKLDLNNFSSLRSYFRDYQAALGITKKAIIDAIGQNADHCFRWNSSQWDLPTQETYQAISRLHLKKSFLRREYEDLRREYEDLRREYEDLRREYEDLRYIHNLDENHNNVWRSKERNRGLLHPTQKPLDLITRIIKTSSHPGQIVLDPFVGSGTIAVAAKQLGRDYLGIEVNPEYVQIAENRIGEANKDAMGQNSTRITHADFSI